MLLQQGKYDAAIEKLHEANLKGPHFADPIEMWGEALIYAGQKDEAKKQFALAALLDLSAADKAVLTSTSARVN